MPSKSLLVPVEPSVLIWARTSAGRTIGDVASKLKIDEQILRNWESGDDSPNLNQVEILSTYYQRPLAVFFLPKPPIEPPLPEDFRSLKGERRLPISSKTRFVMRRARRLQSIASRLNEGMHHSIFETVGKVELSDDPDALAEKIRNILGIDLKRQFNWEKDVEALSNWIRAIETLNILVLQMSMPIQDARAFSLIGQSYPVIVINSKDNINGRIFSLFHELCHILLNREGICDPNKRSESPKQTRSIERFCNRFAGSVLVPAEGLLGHIQVKNNEGEEWSNIALKSLSLDFKVSQEVILRRLLILGLTSEAFYNNKRQQWRIKEERDLQKEQTRGSGGNITITEKCIRRNGVPIVSLVLKSYRSQKITKSDVADYLGVRLKHLPSLERAIGV